VNRRRNYTVERRWLKVQSNDGGNVREVRGSRNTQVRDEQNGLGEEHPVVQDRMFVRGVAIRPPLAPGVSVVAQLGAGNQA